MSCLYSTCFPVLKYYKQYSNKYLHIFVYLGNFQNTWKCYFSDCFPFAVFNNALTHLVNHNFLFGQSFLLHSLPWEWLYKSSHEEFKDLCSYLPARRGDLSLEVDSYTASACLRMVRESGEQRNFYSGQTCPNHPSLGPRQHQRSQPC